MAPTQSGQHLDDPGHELHLVPGEGGGQGVELGALAVGRRAVAQALDGDVQGPQERHRAVAVGADRGPLDVAVDGPGVLGVGLTARRLCVRRHIWKSTWRTCGQSNATPQDLLLLCG